MADNDPGLRAETLAYTAVYIAQMAAYAYLAIREINRRDNVLDKEIPFLDYLFQRRHEHDWPQLFKKKAALTDIPDRPADICTSAGLFLKETQNDGRAMTDMQFMFVNRSCRGIPTGWGLHDGQLGAAIAQASAGSYMVTADKRRHEDWKVKRARLVHDSHIAVKGLFGASTVLSYYKQAVAVFEGLASVFISGFNSAGAGLGTMLDKFGAQPTDKNVIRSSDFNLGSKRVAPVGIGRRPDLAPLK